MNDTNGLIEQKVNDLTESLYRTTDVLSSADRMIDHYCDLSREQEHEIARVNQKFLILSTTKLFLIQF